MASLPVYNASGEKVGDFDIDPDSIAPEINKQLLHDAVVMYQANLRLGTHKTKSRGQVAGSTKKMYRQKGTGNARAGSKRSGIRRGGGHIHCIKPRDYSYRLPRKALAAATRMAVASKIKDGEVVVLESLHMESPKTKEVAGLLKKIDLSGSTLLLATAVCDAAVYKSARNIPGVTVSPQAELNALSVLKPKKMLITKEALEALVDRLGKPIKVRGSGEAVEAG